MPPLYCCARRDPATAPSPLASGFFRESPGTHRNAIRDSHAQRRNPHPRRPPEAQGGTRGALHRQAPRGRRAHQGGTGVRRHHRELGVRRRQERTGDAREPYRGVAGEAAPGDGDPDRGALHGCRAGRLGGTRQRRKDGQVGEVHDRRLGRGQAGGAQALKRVSRWPRSARSQAQRDRRGQGPARARAQAQDHQDRRRPEVVSGAMSASEPEPAAGAAGRHGLSELIAERRAKAQRLRQSDAGAFPYSFKDAEPVKRVLDAYAHLSAGDETDDLHRVAGRIAARRGSGGAAFLDLVDRTGKIQLHARLDVLGEKAFERLTSLDLGDVIGVEGAALRSRRGEISLRVDRFAILTKALRPPPDKHAGLSDVQTRYRRRELDLMASEDARRLFIDRARIISAVRAYLDEEGFIEVETPVLQPLYGGALARPFLTPHNELDPDLYPGVATEGSLKRPIVR